MSKPVDQKGRNDSGPVWCRRSRIGVVGGVLLLLAVGFCGCSTQTEYERFRDGYVSSKYMYAEQIGLAKPDISLSRFCELAELETFEEVETFFPGVFYLTDEALILAHPRKEAEAGIYQFKFEEIDGYGALKSGNSVFLVFVVVGNRSYAVRPSNAKELMEALQTAGLEELPPEESQSYMKKWEAALIGAGFGAAIWMAGNSFVNAAIYLLLF